MCRYRQKHWRPVIKYLLIIWRVGRKSLGNELMMIFIFVFFILPPQDSCFSVFGEYSTLLKMQSLAPNHPEVK